MQILDPTHPFFKPLWRRVLTAVLPALWAMVEIYNGEIAWAIAFLAAGGYAAWELLIRYDPARNLAAEQPAEPKPATDEEQP